MTLYLRQTQYPNVRSSDLIIHSRQKFIENIDLIRSKIVVLIEYDPLDYVPIAQYIVPLTYPNEFDYLKNEEVRIVTSDGVFNCGLEDFFKMGYAIMLAER